MDWNWTVFFASAAGSFIIVTCSILIAWYLYTKRG